VVPVPAVPALNAPRARVTKPAAKRGTQQPALAAAASPAAAIPAKPRPSRVPRVSAKTASPPTGPAAESAGLWPFPTGARP
jgi:hypothetical protein